jgi:uncharacterized protein YdaL
VHSGKDKLPPTPAPPKAPVTDVTALSVAGRRPTKPPTPPPPTTGFNGTGVVSSSVNTLILYDTTNDYGWLGELYAQETANLVSHFGAWSAKPVVNYVAGDLAKYSAAIYIGSTYDEPLPAAFLTDALATTKPLVWMNDNIWQLVSRAGGTTAFSAKYGWYADLFDYGSFSSVRYRGQTLSRNPLSGAILSVFTTPKASVLATVQRSDGVSIPYITWGGSMWYVGDIPFSYISETDRYLAFSDVLFDVLGQSTVNRHRALVRLEDITPYSDPVQLKAAADYLSQQHIPFGFSVTPYYRDPLGYYDPTPVAIRLRNAKAVANAIVYMQSKGGMLIDHGYTHQWDGGINPYNEVTGDDDEFYRVTENADHTLNYVGPLPGDSVTADVNRITTALSEFKMAKVSTPAVWETPHYAGTVDMYKAVASLFATRWERSLYIGGYASGTLNYNHVSGQFFPYVIRDVFGTKVLPENLGNISADPWYGYKPTLPEDIINAAKANLVVRDGFAAFYFHPYLDLSYLQQTVEGIKAAGYTFVNPAGLLGTSAY